VYVNIPKLNLDNTIVNYKDLYSLYKTHKKPYTSEYAIDEKGFNEFKRESNKVVSYLVKEFELRKNADQMKRASTARTGDLNMEKIYSYKFTDDIFKKMTIVPGAKSHGLVMFIDWSGSMSYHLSNTIKQLLNLVLFCKKVNIPYEVYAFKHGNDKKIAGKKNGDLIMGDFSLMNLLSSKMTAAEFSFAGAALTWIGNNTCDLPYYMRMNSTPLNESIVAAMDIIPKFQKDNKLQIVNTVFLTDGEGDMVGNYYNEGGEFKYYGSHVYQEGKYLANRMIIRDPLTKNQEKISSMGGTTTHQTVAFINLLKKRTRCNVLGFYVLSSNEFKKYGHRFFEDYYESATELRKEFNKNKSIVSNLGAFDEYYLIKSDRNEMEEEEMVVKSKTTKGFVNAFTKYNNTKLANRSVLNRFIGLIT
jgi:hypothetical protein